MLCCVEFAETRLLVSEGSSVELACRKPARTSDNSTVAEWKYGRSAGQSALRISFNRRVRLSFRMGRRYSVKSPNDSAEGVLDFSLTIRQVSRYDEGSYTCLITDQSTEIRRVVQLDVTGT